MSAKFEDMTSFLRQEDNDNCTQKRKESLKNSYRFKMQLEEDMQVKIMERQFESSAGREKHISEPQFDSRLETQNEQKEGGNYNYTPSSSGKINGLKESYSNDSHYTPKKTHANRVPFG